MPEIPSEAALLDAVATLVAAPDEYGVLERTADLAQQMSAADYSAAVALDSAGIRLLVHRGMTDAQVSTLPHPPQGLGVLEAVLIEAVPLRLERLQDHPASVGFPSDHVPMAAFLGVPLLREGEVIGAIYLTRSPDSGTFTQAHQDSVTALGRLAGQALVAARAVAAASRHSDVIEAALQLSGVSPELTPQAALDNLLVAAQAGLGMEFAFVSRLSGDEQTFTHVSGPECFPLTAGTTGEASGGYCAAMVEGELPNVLPDARRDLRTAAMPVTAELGVGAYAGVPIHLSDGRLYGTLCCLSPDPQHGLGERDVAFLRVLAQLAASQLERLERAEAVQREVRQRLEAALEGGITIVTQPVVDLRSGVVLGQEALSRFAVPPQRGPDEWFAEAAEAGLGVELELAAVRAALAQLPRLPKAQFLAVNLSPEYLTRPETLATLAAAPLDRIVVEITEHAPVRDYGPARRARPPAFPGAAPRGGRRRRRLRQPAPHRAARPRPDQTRPRPHRHHPHRPGRRRARRRPAGLRPRPRGAPARRGHRDGGP
ncbi:MAG: GAF domain-containing protein, partial [Actinomycetota bacterium]|nr:GAF domain-containing protein [Actinomycetota bacterium]